MLYRIGLLQLRRLLFIVAVVTCGAASVQAQGRDRPEAGDFDYYVLAMSWSPTHCQLNGGRRDRDDAQCGGERPHAFILHGLWPQWWRRWPEYCWTKKREWVSNEVIRDMMDIMPGKGLIIHQYRKHGSCSGMDPERYFGTARALYESIRIPDAFKRPNAQVTTTPDDVEKAFLDANPQLTADMLAVSCKNGLVDEVRVCFSRDRKPAKCGGNEDQARLCRSDRLLMPPVRWTPPGL
ncbi:MAG: ribonuclease T2 [Hyphomicrobiales bacterium]|nr:ribonuclease T2 [Hyphomicrobiales bacterium]